MPDPDVLQKRILEHVAAEGYQPQRPRQLAKALALAGEGHYGTFRSALRDLMDEGRVALGSSGAIVLPSSRVGKNELVGTYRHNRKGFGFVVPTDPQGHEDLFVPPGNNEGAITGDVVRAKIIPRGQREGRSMYEGRVLEILERKHTRFVGTVSKVGDRWFVYPDGNTFTEPIHTPDAAARYVTPGTKVVVELTTFPDDTDKAAEGVITEVLGKQGEKDVDLKSVIFQFGLPTEWPEAARAAATEAVRDFDAAAEMAGRMDLTGQLICTIDPDDAKDYDDAISLSREDGLWKLGVHIADVSYFVEQGEALDAEAYNRGNSTYFPGHVIPMLPEVLSNGVCSLVEGSPRLVKSAWIWLDEKGRPVRTAFSNSVINSKRRLRYVEAQDLIDGRPVIRVAGKERSPSDYSGELVGLLRDMDTLAKLIQKRRLDAGQIVLDLPQVELVLDEKGKVVGAAEEDHSFTHTLIEMFMVEANEAVARLFRSMDVPHMRRIHPGPDADAEERLKHFTQTAGHKLAGRLDRKAIQALLAKVKGKPEEFAINLAVLKSISRAEYSPKLVGHFALASEDYCHFTSPIRRYADLTVHRLLDRFFEATRASFRNGPVGAPKRGQRVQMGEAPSAEALEETGKHISYTERRSEDAERELRKVKVLELLEQQVGAEFRGVVTGITTFGVYVQLDLYLVDGLTRYEELLDDWWNVDTKAGVVRGERTGLVIRIGDVVRVRVARVDLPRRELDLQIFEVLSRGRGGTGKAKHEGKPKPRAFKPAKVVAGAQRRSQRSKSRDRSKRR